MPGQGVIYFVLYDSLVTGAQTKFEHQCDVITFQPYCSMYWHSFTCRSTTCFVQWVGKATLSHACLITSLILRDCVIHVHVHVESTVPGMCDQRHYDQSLCVRESNLFSSPTVGYPMCSDKWRPDK